jgi:hypothetical protein
MQYCRRISSRDGGVLVLGRGGRTVFVVEVLVGVGSTRSSDSRSVVRVLVDFGVGFGVGFLVGVTVVFCTGGGGGVDGVTFGGTTVGVGVGVLSSTTWTACEPDSPPNSPTADTAQKPTPSRSTSPPTPADTDVRVGPPYRPIGPRTGLPLPSTQNRQPSGGGGQDGSGRQVFGGTQ